MIAHLGTAVNILYQLLAHFYLLLLRAQQDIHVLVLIDDIEVELRVTRCVTDDRHHIVDHRLINGLARDIDGEPLDAFILHCLQIFNVLYLKRI